MNSGSWCWTGRPVVLWFMELQRVAHDWVTELNWTEKQCFILHTFHIDTWISWKIFNNIYCFSIFSLFFVAICLYILILKIVVWRISWMWICDIICSDFWIKSYKHFKVLDTFVKLLSWNKAILIRSYMESCNVWLLILGFFLFFLNSTIIDI